MYLLPTDTRKDLNANIKAYYVVDINTFAFADRNVRVLAGLMEVMTGNEILAIIGREISHVANKDYKDAFKNAFLTSALKDALGSKGQTATNITDSQVGACEKH